MGKKNSVKSQKKDILKKTNNERKTNKRKNKSSKRKQLKSKEMKRLPKPSKGIKPHKIKWNNFDFWDTLFHPYHIQHMYIENKLMFAELIIYKEPINDVRGYIQFHIDGPVTLNKVDSDEPTSVHRISVGKDDRIMFRVGDDDINTEIDYLPKYQQDMIKNKSGIRNENAKFGHISKDRINDINDIFNWLKYTTKPRDFEDIMKKVEIERGVKIKNKELLEME